MHFRRMAVEKHSPDKGCPGCQKVMRELCHHALRLHTVDERRERMERLMNQNPVRADRVVRTDTHDEAFAKPVKEHNERQKKIARHSPNAEQTTHHQPSSSLSSSSGGKQSRQQCAAQAGKSNDDVHKQDADMNNYDKERQVPTVRRNRQSQYDKDKTARSKDHRPVATHHSKPQHAGVFKFWDCVNGSELNAREVQRHVDWKWSLLVRQAQDWQRARHGQVGRHSETAGYEGRGWWRKSSAAGPKSMHALLWDTASGIGGNSSEGPDCMVWTRKTREQLRDRDDAHRHQKSVLSRSSKEEKYVVLPPVMWSKGCPEYGKVRVSLYGTSDATAKWEVAYPEVLQQHQFARGGCVSTFVLLVKEKGIRIIVHGMTSRLEPKSQLEWLERVMDKHFESKHTMMGGVQ